MMKSAVFVEPNRIALKEKPVPDVGPLDALIRITTTTICATDTTSKWALLLAGYRDGWHL